MEDLDEQEDDTGASGSEYYNISDFCLPDGGVPFGELPQIIEKIRKQPGGFEAEYKVREYKCMHLFVVFVWGNIICANIYYVLISILCILRLLLLILLIILLFLLLLFLLL